MPDLVSDVRCFGLKDIIFVLKFKACMLRDTRFYSPGIFILYIFCSKEKLNFTVFQLQKNEIRLQKSLVRLDYFGLKSTAPPISI